jgi:hypothetical protein
MQRHTSIFMSRIVKGSPKRNSPRSRNWRVGPCSQNQLGRLIYLDAATTGAVDRLAARGFISARPDAHDRRRRAIAPPTPAARSPTRRRSPGSARDAHAADGGGAADGSAVAAQADVGCSCRLD